MPYGGKKRLAKEFNVSEQAVYDALNYKTNSDTANKIRERAFLMNGILIDLSKISEETNNNEQEVINNQNNPEK